MTGFLFSRAEGEAPDYDPGVTGQYLKPLLERASVQPKVVETKPKRPARSRRVTVNEDEPDLIAAK
jgi:hypothetical protein